MKMCGPGSSVGIATELRAERSRIESQWGRDFPTVKTGPEAHPASCTMGTGSFPAVKCGRGVLLTTHPFLVPRSCKSRAIPLPTLWATPGLWRDHFIFFYENIDAAWIMQRWMTINWLILCTTQTVRQYSTYLLWNTHEDTPKYAVHLGISILFYRRSKCVLGGAKATWRYRQRVKHRVPHDSCAALHILNNTYKYLCRYAYILVALIGLFCFGITWFFHRHSILLPVLHGYETWSQQTLAPHCAQFMGRGRGKHSKQFPAQRIKPAFLFILLKWR